MEKMKRKPVTENRLTAIYAESRKREDFLKKYCDYVTGLFLALDYRMISDVIDCFSRARERGSTIFFLGNGGSAATASHFAQDLGEVGRKSGNRSFRTICVNDSVPFLTALGNDYGYDSVFTGQLSNLFTKGDILVAISASGNSRNVIEASRLAKEREGTVIGLVGFDGGQLAKIADHAIHVSTNAGEYGPVEDVHLVLDHMVTSFIMLQDISEPKKGRQL